MSEPTLPTGDQCNDHEQVFETDEKVGYAIWYPQMGGYVGKAVAVMEKRWTEDGDDLLCPGCIDVYVWHDGDFPFGQDRNDGRVPIRIHHCDPEQFVEFGQTLARLNAQGEEPDA